MINNILLVGTANYRTYCYLKACLTYNWPCKEILIYGIPTLDISLYEQKEYSINDFTVKFDLSFTELLAQFNVTYSNASSFNDLTKELKHLNIKNILFSGSGKVSPKLVKTYKVIHAHPGLLPKYRGSTTFYYSLLSDREIYCTTFIMDANLDTGQKLNEISASFEACKNLPIDDILDPLIRAKCINYLFNSNQNSNNKPILHNQENKLYYKIHPILRRVLHDKLFN